MMINCIRRYGVAAALVLAFAAAVMATGNTFAAIQKQQRIQTAAISCLLDERCFLATHQLVHARMQPATTLI